MSVHETDLTAPLSCQFAAASHCAFPGSTPPVKNTLSASSLVALTQSPLLCQGQTPPPRRKCVQGNPYAMRKGSALCLQLNDNVIFSVSILHASKKLGMNWEVWEGGSSEERVA